MIIMAMVVLGIFTYIRLGVDLMPKVDFPIVIVTPELLGASPEEITAVVDAMLGASQPVIFVGHGVTLSEASKELTELVHRVEIPVISSPNGMGAFDMTYGTLSRVWTTIDFSLTDNVGPATGPYRNPDVAGRKVKAIHLSEGDLENGVPYSVASTYKWELSLTWREDANPMPTAQLLALMEMFESGSNQIEISLGGMPLVPPNFVPAYIVRSSGFEFADVIGGLADTSVPTPVKEIIVRLT